MPVEKPTPAKVTASVVAIRIFTVVTPIVISLVLIGGPASAQDGQAPAVPQRPSLSSPVDRSSDESSSLTPGSTVSDIQPPAQASSSDGTAEAPALPPPVASPSAVDPAIPSVSAVEAPAAAETTAPASDPAGTLPHELSPMGMFLAADMVVKSVIVGLLLASVLSWTVWLAKLLQLTRAQSRLKRAQIALSRADSLQSAAASLDDRSGIAHTLIDAAKLELQLSRAAPDKAGIKERLISRLQDAVGDYTRSLNKGTGILATIGAMSPFVGLFGTVWGIMNSFIGIARTQTTNLAVVAPGIAEALLATAIGLVAAIPAVMFYNALARRTQSCKAQASSIGSEVMRIVSRDLDTHGTALLRQAAE